MDAAVIQTWAHEKSMSLVTETNVFCVGKGHDRFSAGPSHYSRQSSGLQRFAPGGEMGYLENFFPLTLHSCPHFIMGARQHE